MKLILTQGWTGKEKLISSSATEQEIRELLNSLDWQEFHWVQLEKDPDNWLAVSGNLAPDGLAIIYEEDATEFISNEAPETISQLEETLILYFKGDQRFKDFGFSSGPASLQSIPDKKPGYDQWKIEYEAKRKIQKRKHRKAFAGTIVFMALSISILHLWSIDELKFIGRETSRTTAVVSKTKSVVIKGGSIHRVFYEFEHDGNVYWGYFNGSGVSSSPNVGDSVIVKFASSKPSISKLIGTIKRKS